MTNELTFNTESAFEAIRFDKSNSSWTFSFTDNISVNCSGFWRLLHKGKIRLVSFDEAQQFGHPEKLNLADQLEKVMTGKVLESIVVSGMTFDLILSLTDELTVEIYTSSSGYESYEFSINSKRYIGVGGGGIMRLDTA